MIDISVIIPTYNAEKYLYRLVQSLDRQTVTNFEVIFVDDCSTDNTVQTLRSLTESVSFKSKIHISQSNGGPGAARNTGVKLATGIWGCFIDVDDYLSSNYFEELMLHADADTDVVISATYKVWDDGRTREKYSLNDLKQHIGDKRYLTCTLDFGPWGKIFRLDLWRSKQMCFPTDIRGEDGAIIPALFFYSRKISFAEKAIYYYYQAPNSRSRNDGKFFDDIFQACTMLTEYILDPIVIEYKFVRLVGYGVLMNAIRHGEPKAILLKYCNYLAENYPDGYKNRYFKTIDWRKRVFIRMAYRKRLNALRFLVKIAK